MSKLKSNNKPNTVNITIPIIFKINNKICDVELVQGAVDYRIMTRQMVDAIISMKEYNRYSKGLFSFVGFKTKWSMYNEVTWQKTHRFTGFASVITGILTILSGIFFKEMVNFIILMSLIIKLIRVICLKVKRLFYLQKEKKEQRL